MHVCARCPRQLVRSCCEVQPGEHLASLTLADAARVEAETGLEATRFAEWETLDEGEAMQWEALHPQWAGYLGPSRRRLTLRRDGSACVFHHAQTGCQLSAEARPVACRLYPFALLPSGEWGLQVDRYGSVEDAQRAVRTESAHACLAVEEADSFDGLRSLFGVTREGVEALGQQLVSEVRAHRKGVR